MKMSQSFISTLRETPRDAEVLSQQLMLRGSMLRKHGAGLYSYLPLFVRSYHKLCHIVREELDGIGWQEVIMPFVCPAELWQETGRWSVMGHLMLRLKDRKGQDYCLGPTHEEVVTDIVRNQVTSYKQLPLTLYQITPKFRDELRPRFGVMRAREFVMMDGYSFHANREDLDAHYEIIAKAYGRIFERAGLKYFQVEADTGAMGGSGSHEFHVLAQSGEDAILSYAEANYAANREQAEVPSAEIQEKFAKKNWGMPTSKTYEEVATPTQRTIEEVSKFLALDPHRCLKTVVYGFKPVGKGNENWKAVVTFILGNRELNECKLLRALGKLGYEVEALSPMPPQEVENLFAAPVGFLGPIPQKGKSFQSDVTFVFDREVLAVHDAVMGANREGFHLKHVEPLRDISLMDKNKNVFDLVFAEKGELCPKPNAQGNYGVYTESRGIEVGHIFKLGTKYAKAMGAQFQDATKQNQVMEMGCYGIGVTRVLAACLEQHHDENGMIWPQSIAPYTLALLNLGTNDAECVRVANALYEELRKRKIEVLYDDRDMSPGAKFKDADLLGMPFRLVVGKRALDAKELEFVVRKASVKSTLPFDSKDISRFVSNFVGTKLGASL